MMKRQRKEVALAGVQVLQQECIELIGRFIGTSPTFFSFLRALPVDVLGLPLQSLMLLSQSMALDHLWPRLILDHELYDEQIELIRKVSRLYTCIEISGMWDLRILRRCFPPTTEIELRNAPDDIDFEMPLVQWYHELATFRVTKVRLCDYFGGLNIPENFLSTLGRFTHLRRLHIICMTALTTFEQDLLFKSLDNAPIESIYLYQSPWELSAISASYLIGWLSTKRATRLGLKHCNISPATAPLLHRAFADSPCLKELRLRYGNMGLCLSSIYQLPIALNVLVLDECQLNANSVRLIALLLPSSSIKKLDLSRNRIQDSGAQHLATVLPHTKLTSLNLATSDIGTAGGTALAAVLSLTRLQTLQLGGNPVGNETALAIAAALPHCKYLRWLDLSKSFLTDQGSVTLVSAIPICPSLRSLDISCNWMTYQGARDIAGMIARCVKLEYLSVSLNPIEERGIVALIHGLSSCSNLEINAHVVLSEEALKRCSTLARQLHVSDAITLE